MFSSGLKIHETCRSVARAAEVAYDIIKDLETTGKSTVGKIITIIIMFIYKIHLSGANYTSTKRFEA